MFLTYSEMCSVGWPLAETDSVGGVLEVRSSRCNLATWIPSVRGMLVYKDYTSWMTRRVSLGSVEMEWSLFRKCAMSLI